MKLVELPWGDFVEPKHVVGVSVERHGETLFVDVSTDVEGLHYSSGAINKIGEAYDMRMKTAKIIASDEVVHLEDT